MLLDDEIRALKAAAVYRVLRSVDKSRHVRRADVEELLGRGMGLETAYAESKRLENERRQSFKGVVGALMYRLRGMFSGR